MLIIKYFTAGCERTLSTQTTKTDWCNNKTVSTEIYVSRTLTVNLISNYSFIVCFVETREYDDIRAFLL